MSMIELMVAISVLMIGVLGSMVVVTMAIGSNFRNRQRSNSTAVSQMVLERMMAVGANQNPVLNITDCAAPAVTWNVTTAGGGGSLDANGNVDFTQARNGAGDPPGYYMLFTDCGQNGKQIVYDVRWNIQTPTVDTKLITVSTRMAQVGASQEMYSPAATVRSMLGP
jgi:Tfp pilus assembly protein PilV